LIRTSITLRFSKISREKTLHFPRFTTLSINPSHEIDHQSSFPLAHAPALL